VLKKGTHVTSYTLILHEKYCYFYGKGGKGVEPWIFIHVTDNVLFNISTRFVKTSQLSSTILVLCCALSQSHQPS